MELQEKIVKKLVIFIVMMITVANAGAWDYWIKSTPGIHPCRLPVSNPGNLVPGLSDFTYSFWIKTDSIGPEFLLALFPSEGAISVDMDISGLEGKLHTNFEYNDGGNQGRQIYNGQLLPEDSTMVPAGWIQTGFSTATREQ